MKRISAIMLTMIMLAATACGESGASVSDIAAENDALNPTDEKAEQHIDPVETVRSYFVNRDDTDYEIAPTELIYVFLRQHRTKPALRALHASCLHIFRHIAQVLLGGRQPAGIELVQSDKKPDGAICAQALCGVALNEEETERFRIRQSGTESAAESASDPSGAVCVTALYYCQYGHTKTFMDDGYCKAHCYLLQDDNTGYWEIVDMMTPANYVSLENLLDSVGLTEAGVSDNAVY